MQRLKSKLTVMYGLTFQHTDDLLEFIKPWISKYV